MSDEVSSLREIVATDIRPGMRMLCFDDRTETVEVVERRRLYSASGVDETITVHFMGTTHKVCLLLDSRVRVSDDPPKPARWKFWKYPWR